MNKKITAILLQLSKTSRDMATQALPISSAQIDWLLQGCVVVLRKLGVSIEQVERAWNADEAMDRQEAKK